ncbi:MAG: hypothetical protein ACE5KT_03130 [Methanosarcinales archaeon]
MQTKSKYEEDILLEIRDIPPMMLPKISKMIRFLKNEILSDVSQDDLKKKDTFASLEGIFEGKSNFSEEEIKEVQFKFKEILNSHD